MSVVPLAVSDMLVTVKSREVQRGMLAEMRDDGIGVARHFLAAAHLELVLADDYAESGQEDLALRSRLSAASCFWRASQVERARDLFDQLIDQHPNQSSEIRHIIADLEASERQGVSGKDKGR